MDGMPQPYGGIQLHSDGQPRQIRLLRRSRDA
jgi:hypothetical protein